MGRLLRKRFFWLGIFSSAFISAVFALKLFPLAFPILHINLTDNKKSIRIKARELADRLKIGPAECEQAVSFGHDDLTKRFVELECGGKEAVVEMMKKGLYEPYAWVIRHFKEQEIYELFLTFTPDGKPYGFMEIISEDEPGAQIKTHAARTLAERVAQDDWNIDFSLYKHVETSKETKPGGRTDRSFTYERTDTRLGNGHYRLRLTVSGDRLSELTHFVYIPEEFINRYEEMRSSNETLAGAAQALVMFLYGLCCCAFGFFFLLRKRYLLWRTPLILALIMSVLSMLASLNTLPLMWLGYDTALSKLTFIIGKLTGIAMIFFSTFAATFVVLMMAESLSRCAFPNHLRLWQIWRKQQACSLAVLGRTIGGYVITGFELLFQVLFFILTANYFGWWTPSDSLIDPNVLATYFPWLNPIADSLSAGIYEEALYRAIPLSCAILAGKKLGRERFFIIAALIFQAILFGAVHANYPQQPSYARIVELAIPSFFYGLIYLRFGLLPAIISHASFDLVWYALPLFVSGAPGALANRLTIIAVALTPVLYILFQRVRSYAWCSLTADAYNKTWQPPPPRQREITSFHTRISTLSPSRLGVMTITAVVGMALWFLTTAFKQNAPALTLERQRAIEVATQTLVERYAVTPDEWHPLARAYGSDNYLFSHRFIWQEGGASTYKSLLSSYLDAPAWVIRFVKFTGTIDERAEEYRVIVGNNDVVSRVIHKVPEARPGAQLTEEEARKVAREALKIFEMDSDEAEEISAISSKHDNRIDWNFIFVNDRIYPLEEGQARITIHLAGNTIADTARYVHVPEDWQRHEQERDDISGIIGGLCSLLPYLLFLAAAVVSLAQASSRIALLSLLEPFIFLALIFLLQLLNRWPIIEFGFNTNEPFLFQIIQVMGPTLVLVILVRAGMFAAMLSLARTWHARYRIEKRVQTFILSLGLGGALAGAISFLQLLTTRKIPLWADYSPVGSIYPVAGMILGEISHFLTLSISLLGLQVLICYLTCGNKLHRRILITLVAILLGFAAAGSTQPIGNFLFFGLAGILTSLFGIAAYFMILRLDYTLAPAVAAGFAMLRIVQQAAFNAYPYAQYGAAISVLAIIAIAWYIFSTINHVDQNDS